MNYLEYLGETLGLRVSSTTWNRAENLPLYLTTAADYELCTCDGIEFVVAQARANQSLPELKRIVAQLNQLTDKPVVLATDDVNPRQVRALVAQGIPIVVPGSFTYLPFLGVVAQRAAEKHALGDKLTPRAQAAMVALIAHPDISSSAGLRELTHMSPSSVSRAVDELARRSLIERGKNGRDVTFYFEKERNALLKKALPLLQSPVRSVKFARRTSLLDELPDAGETALAGRSMLTAPSITQKALAKTHYSKFAVEKVLEGELADENTIELQLWSYEPLIVGFEQIDDVSLAISLVGLSDERIEGELNELFGEEDLWQ